MSMNARIARDRLRGTRQDRARLPRRRRVEATCQPGETVQLVFPQKLDQASRERVEASLPQGVSVGGWKSDESTCATAAVTTPDAHAAALVRGEIEEARSEVEFTLDAACAQRQQC